MKVLTFRIQSDGVRCFGCGRIKWVDRKSHLCLFCLGTELDKRDKPERERAVRLLRKKLLGHGEEIKAKLAEFNAVRPRAT